MIAGEHADSSGLRVSGGVGGITVTTEDMVLAAARIEGLAAILAECARAGDVINSGLASAECWFADPAGHVLAHRAMEAALSGAGGVRGLSCRFASTASNLRTAAAAYAAADHSGQTWFERAGQCGEGALVPFLAAGAGAAGLLDVLGAGGALVPALGHWAGLHALGILVRNDQFTETLTGVAPEVIGALAGRPELDTGPELAVQILAWASTAGALLANHPWYQDNGVGTAALHGPAPAAAPTSVATLLGQVPASSAAQPQVRIERIDSPQGRRWIVLIPGTAGWSPVSGANPFDGSGAIGSAALRRTAGVDAVEKAMDAVGIPPGEPVLIAGHSQGGMIGASVAADTAIAGRFTITHLVTAGAPIASAPIPSTVQVLSIEHTDDLIPKLDGARNPDRATWVTVTRRALSPADDQLSGHDLSRYIQTGAAADGSPDASVRAWKDSARGFFGSPGSTATSWTVLVGRSS